MLICILSCLIFGSILFSLRTPSQGTTYHFSPEWEGEAPPADWVYDQKGWQVFCRQGQTTTALEANGYGGFTGLPTPGQTFYYSRVMTEELDSPILELSPRDCNIAVFLEDFLLYTDCPELDNRIGYLELPMRQTFRTEPVILSLPEQYLGKTLTVAQSTIPQETPAVWLSPVSLYQSSVQEQQLAASSSSTAISATIFFCAGALLLFFFIWQVLSGRTNPGLLFLALVAFLWSCSQVVSTGFFPKTSFLMLFDSESLIRLLTVFNLILFLTSRLTAKYHRVGYWLGGLFFLCTLGNILPFFNLSLEIPVYLGLFTLFLLVAAMVWERRQGNFFAKVFLPLVLVKISIFLLIMVLRPEKWQNLSALIQSDPTHRSLLWLTMRQLLPSAIGAAIVEWTRLEIDFMAEKHMMVRQYKLAQSSFENLQRNQEEVMMLRHDMKKHLTYLRQSTQDPATAQYLDTLLGQEQAVPSVIRTENQTMNILLNAKLGEAAAKHIGTEVVRSDIPENLPIPDTDLCALVMNLLDNAIQAAVQAETPSIRLDLHQKDGFFVFTCENTTGPEAGENAAKKQAVSKHGLGLKIVNQIVTRHGILMDVQSLTGIYRVTLALSLGQSRR